MHTLAFFLIRCQCKSPIKFNFFNHNFQIRQIEKTKFNDFENKINKNQSMNKKIVDNIREVLRCSRLIIISILGSILIVYFLTMADLGEVNLAVFDGSLTFPDQPPVIKVPCLLYLNIFHYNKLLQMDWAQIIKT